MSFHSEVYDAKGTQIAVYVEQEGNVGFGVTRTEAWLSDERCEQIEHYDDGVQVSVTRGPAELSIEE